MRTPGSREPGRRRTQRAPLVRRRFGRRLALGVTAFTAMAVAGAPAVLAVQHHGAAAVAVSTAVPLLATTAGEPAGAPVDGIHADTLERVRFHIHAHLQIYVDGQQRIVPGGIGIVPPYTVQTTPDGPFVAAGAAFYWLHTHDATGVIHIESPVRRTYTLGEFFDVWGQPLGPDQVGPAHGRVTALVNGVRVPGDPRHIPLGAHDVLQLAVGPVQPFHPYEFAPGL
jgi:hypothetical protein